MALGSLGLTGLIARRKERLHQCLKPARGELQRTSRSGFGVAASRVGGQRFGRLLRCRSCGLRKRFSRGRLHPGPVVQRCRGDGCVTNYRSILTTQ